MQKVLCVFTICASVFAKSLDFNDVKTINEKMFAYHVLFDSYNETVAQRSVSKILASFDPVAFYFLQSERDKYNNVSSIMVKEYETGSFKTYTSIRQDFEYSVKRCRQLRASVRAEILNETIDINTVWIEAPRGAPESREVIKKNITIYMVSQLKGYADSRSITTLSYEDKARVLDFYENKLQEHEEKCLCKQDYPLTVSKMIASSLDAHSMIYGNDEIENINAHLKSRFEGIGIYVNDDIDGPTISGVVQGGPAERCDKIEAGDTILFVNGVDTTNIGFKKVMELLTVKEGSQIVLHLKSRSGEQKMIKLTGEKITMKKDKIFVEVEPFLDGQIAKLRVDTFYNDFEGGALAHDLKKTILELRRQKPLYGVVIDMRKNLGGFFNEAVKSIALFSKKETVVIAKFRDDQVRFSKEFDPHITYMGPLVILTSKYSASAAEILAQSLKDVGVAIIAGDEQTYGKGSIQFQTITDGQSEYKYKVTVGQYYTISGYSTQLKGVTADIIVPSQYAKQRIGERHNLFALPSGDLHKRHGLHPEVREIFEYNSSRKKTAFEVMLPRLRENSQQRIANNKNYQAFISNLGTLGTKKGQTREEKREALYGKNDLQMIEATNIIKDMHMIQTTY